MKRLPIIACIIGLAAPLCAAEDYLSQGAGHLCTGDYRNAVRSFELAIKTSQDGAAAYKGLGTAYYHLGDHDIAYDVEMISAAVDAFNQSLSFRQDPEVCYLLGLSYLALYDRENAELAYRRLRPVDGNLAEKLGAQLAAYVRPAKFDYTPAAPPASAPTPVVIEGNRVLVPVRLYYRGVSAQASLVLDTGASVTAISQRLAAELGVEPMDTNPARVTVADGRSVECRWFVADSLAVGPRNLSQPRIAILPGSVAGVDGLLGMDFLKTVRYRVDFGRKAMEWNGR